MRTKASQSIIFLLLIQIMLITPLHAEDFLHNLGLPSLHLPNLGKASAPSLAPENPGIVSPPSPEEHPASPAPVNAGMALPPSPEECPAPTPAPLDTGMAAAPSSGFFHDLGIALPPTLAPLDNLNCSGCPIDPFGLAACGFLIIGRFSRDTISYCCGVLSTLTNEDASACLCHAIQIRALKIGDFDVTDAINKALTACSKL